MFFLIAGILIVFLISLCTGTESCSLQELVQLFSGDEVSDTVRRIFFEIRLPRLLASFLIGGMLAAAGAVSQNLFRNDLASPHVLGIVNASALLDHAFKSCCGDFFPVDPVSSGETAELGWVRVDSCGSGGECVYSGFDIGAVVSCR